MVDLEIITFAGIIGLIVNVTLQFIVWRYLLVYYKMNGSKEMYLKKKDAYNILCVLISLITYPILWILGELFIPIVLVLALALIYFALVLGEKWSNNDILPDPFDSATKKNSRIVVNTLSSEKNEMQALESVGEKAFFTLLEIEGVAKARSVLQEYMNSSNGSPLFP